jgi:sulfatase maturation enzyme AslB (radical SAM superfamily)
MNKTLCSAFWNHTNIRGGDRVFPCCRFKKPIQSFDGNLGAVLHSIEYDKLRQDSSNGIAIPECQKCYMEEDLGKKSLRQEFNELYGTDTIQLKFLEIGFDNICNLTCDGCWVEFSSAWGYKTNPDIPKKLHVLDTTEITAIPDTIERVIFLGGEPLMTNRHISFLNKVKDLTTVSVMYYTNGTFLLKPREIETLKQTKHTHFIVSIDGIGELNDRVRSGSSWSDVLVFLQQLRDLNFKTSIHSVMHLNNWHGFLELSEFVKTEKLEWTVGLLTYPADLSIIHLSSGKKQELRSILEQCEIPNKNFILEYLEHENKPDRKIYKLEQI